MMPLLFALCALLSVAPAQAASLRSEALRDFSPAHFAALALLAAPAAQTTPQTPATSGRAALLLALCRSAKGVGGLSVQDFSVQGAAATCSLQARADKSPIVSHATSHCAQLTAPRLSQTLRAPRTLAALFSQPLFAHEAAQLSGVRTNRTLL